MTRGGSIDSGSRLLIVNADDYGLTPAVSRGILRAHRDGIVSSTSILVVAPAFASTASWLHDAPGLGVGIHFALVGEDPPLLSGKEIPTLIDSRGRLLLNWWRFGLRVLRGAIDPGDVERELDAQMERALGAGLRPDHVNSHQHLHLWPPIREVVLRLCRRHGIRAIRVPRSQGRRLAGFGTMRLASRLERRAAEEGMAVTEDATGLDQAGRMDATALIAALERFARRAVSSAEITVHPGEDPDPDRHRYPWGYSWSGELEALVSRAVAEAVPRCGFVLSTFGDLCR